MDLILLLARSNHRAATEPDQRFQILYISKVRATLPLRERRVEPSSSVLSLKGPLDPTEDVHGQDPAGPT